MKPIINTTEFGSITIDGEKYNHDIIITSAGRIRFRKKELSKKTTGTSHVVSVEEMKYILGPESKTIIVGTGQYGVMTLSEDTIRYFEDKQFSLQILPTPDAIIAWNDAKEPTAGLFHVTC